MEFELWGWNKQLTMEANVILVSASVQMFFWFIYT